MQFIFSVFYKWEKTKDKKNRFKGGKKKQKYKKKTKYHPGITLLCGGKRGLATFPPHTALLSRGMTIASPLLLI